MIQFLTLKSIDRMPYKSRKGGFISARFDRAPGTDLWAAIHNTTEAEFEHWSAEVGKMFPVRAKRIVSPDGTEYEEARLYAPRSDRV